MHNTKKDRTVVVRCTQRGPQCDNEGPDTAAGWKTQLGTAAEVVVVFLQNC